MLQRMLNTYSYDGHANGKVILDTEVTSLISHSSNSDEKWKGLSRMVLPGDPGVYCTGLLGASVASVLLDTTTTTTAEMDSTKATLPPLSGFHSPVDAF
eukprot:9836323-Ditylum_brightwellii.AAC.1